jgi:acetyl-CoA carboxylase biotin carboxylase subunit
MLKKVLVANRGEIALRVVRACRDLGIASVAAHSEADRDASFVALADERVELGPAPAPQSYLAVDRIVAAAHATGADAVHPGYGFLSENPALARAVREAGLVFVGPSPETIERLGSKLGTRRLMREAGVPTPPGADAPTDFVAARSLAETIGYPVLVKPSGGGGGRGMRVIESPDGLERALDAARREAERAFADADVYIEKLFPAARHVEVQIMGDAHGNLVHVGDRDCSLQRRHQKLVEEAPAPGLSPEQHEHVRALALRAARAVDYVNAGTVEFLFDGREFYLLEVNTRIQVEHCVTEAVSGIDLVVEQLRVASGEHLSFRQDDVVLRGTAIEARVYAEDPAKKFLPAPGRIGAARFPAGPWVREDRGVEAGDAITPHYDGLIAKLVVWGATREQAIARTARALAEYRLEGVRTNVAFLRWLVVTEAFRTLAYDTRWVEREFRPEMLAPPVE